MEIRVAACSMVDTDIIRQWFEELDSILSDEDNDDTDIGMWVAKNYDRVEGLWSRLIFAYETIYENSCDQTTRHLEWKSEIKAALAAFAVATEDLPKCEGSNQMGEYLHDSSAGMIYRCPVCHEPCKIEHGHGPGGFKRHRITCHNCGVSYPWVLWDCPLCPEEPMETSIDTFLAEYDADSDIWFTLETGETQNRFEQLRDLFSEAFSLLNNIIESVTSNQAGDYIDTCVDEFEIEKAQKWLSTR